MNDTIAEKRAGVTPYRDSDHKRPTGGSLASGPSPAWLGCMALPPPGRPTGICPGLPARPLACTPRDGARELCERRGCEAALHAAASGRHAASTLLLLADAVGPSAAAGAAVQRPAAVASAHRALRRPTWQPSAAASQRPRGGLSACRVRQAGCHALVEVWAQGWRRMRQVVVKLVRVMRW